MTEEAEPKKRKPWTVLTASNLQSWIQSTDCSGLVEPFMISELRALIISYIPFDGFDSDNSGSGLLISHDRMTVYGEMDWGVWSFCPGAVPLSALVNKSPLITHSPAGGSGSGTGSGDTKLSAPPPPPARQRRILHWTFTTACSEMLCFGIASRHHVTSTASQQLGKTAIAIYSNGHVQTVIGTGTGSGSGGSGSGTTQCANFTKWVTSRHGGNFHHPRTGAVIGVVIDVNKRLMDWTSNGLVAPDSQPVPLDPAITADAPPRKTEPKTGKTERDDDENDWCDNWYPMIGVYSARCEIGTIDFDAAVPNDVWAAVNSW